MPRTTMARRSMREVPGYRRIKSHSILARSMWCIPRAAMLRPRLLAPLPGKPTLANLAVSVFDARPLLSEADQGNLANSQYLAGFGRLSQGLLTLRQPAHLAPSFAGETRKRTFSSEPPLSQGAGMIRFQPPIAQP